MRTPAPAVPDRCRLIRDQLPAFASGTLDEAAAGDVRDHLLSCQSCAEVFSDLLMDDVEQGGIELERPPFVPPVAWHDAYLHADHGRWGTLWKSVRDALESPDAASRAWGEEKRRDVERALAALAAAHGHDHEDRTVAEDRPARDTERRIDADVVSAEGDRSEAAMRFLFEEPPRIADGQFRLRVSTAEASAETLCADTLAVCTLQLNDTLALSFVATLTPGADGRCVVDIQERDLPARAQTLPAGRLRFTVVASGSVPRAR